MSHKNRGRPKLFVASLPKSFSAFGQMFPKWPLNSLRPSCAPKTYPSRPETTVLPDSGRMVELLTALTPTPLTSLLAPLTPLTPHASLTPLSQEHCTPAGSLPNDSADEHLGQAANGGPGTAPDQDPFAYQRTGEPDPCRESESKYGLTPAGLCCAVWP